MTLDEIKGAVAIHKQWFEEAAAGLNAILSHNIESVSLTDAQDLASQIKSALDYIESAVSIFDSIIDEEEPEEPEEDEE